MLILEIHASPTRTGARAWVEPRGVWRWTWIAVEAFDGSCLAGPEHPQRREGWTWTRAAAVRKAEATARWLRKPIHLV